MFTSYFSLREQPFHTTPDPRFFYANPGHTEAYASLLYGIRERKGCIALVGEAGTGKTTLLRRVMRELEPTVHTAFFYNTTLTFDELLDFVCRDFGLSVSGERRLDKIDALNQFLLARLEEGGTGVLIIDEAHNLTDDVLENLRLLSNFETSSQKLLQIVLVGQPELEKKLALPELRQLKQRISIYCRLDRLRAQSVGPFIEHRLRIAGCSREDLFTPEALQRIAVYSDGIPRRINTLCDNALLIAYRAGRQTVGEDIIEEAAQSLALKRAGFRVVSEGTGQGESSTASMGKEGGSVRTRAVELAGLGGPPRPHNTLEEAPHAQAPWFSRFGSKRLTWVSLGLLLALLLGVGRVRLFLRQPSADGAAPRAPGWSAPLTQTMTDLSTQERESPLSDSSSPQAVKLPPAEDQTRAATDPALPPQTTAVEEDGRWTGQAVTIARGDTMSGIVLKMYGDYNVLAFDIIKELNPHLEDFDHVAAGEQVWLPSLTRDTLLRQQVDGSYHLIIGSFHRAGEAESTARTARRRGYVATITQRRMSGTRLLFRVELEQLQDLATADRAWNEIVKRKT
jgi:general secretion pathway protein A